MTVSLNILGDVGKVLKCAFLRTRPHYIDRGSLHDLRRPPPPPPDRGCSKKYIFHQKSRNAENHQILLFYRTNFRNNDFETRFLEIRAVGMVVLNFCWHVLDLMYRCSQPNRNPKSPKFSRRFAPKVFNIYIKCL